MLQNTNQKFLIYIPCWKDYELALAQIAKIHRQFTPELSSKFGNQFSVVTVLSINGVSLSPEELARISSQVDELIYFDSMLGMDTNMNQGFLKAIANYADYYWLLSANDEIDSHAIENILGNLPAAFDLLLFARSKSNEVLTVQSVFLKEFSKYPFGLISSVIYPTNVMSKYFPQAMRLNWTGWGQLAVIESACIDRREITVSTIPEELIFTKPTLDDPTKTRDSIRTTYNHSFFGLPVLINSLHQNDKKFRRKLISQWVRGNWFKLGYFNGYRNPRIFLPTEINQSWIQEISGLIVKGNSPISRILFSIGIRINLDKMSKEYLIGRQIRRFIK